MPPEVKHAIASTLIDGRDAGRITEADIEEFLELLNGERTPWAQSRVDAILERCRTPSADPATEGYESIDMGRMRPDEAAVKFFAAMLAMPGTTPFPTFSPADAGRLRTVQFGMFFNVRMAAVASPWGWMAYVTDGRVLSRSSDLFDTEADARAWCRSIIEREASCQ